jgi:hypothetical protein
MQCSIVSMALERLPAYSIVKRQLEKVPRVVAQCAGRLLPAGGLQAGGSPSSRHPHWLCSCSAGHLLDMREA